MSNDHICRFIGACLDHPYVVYEYCPKGSLEDVLAKEQIKLDWMFKYSLMQDICRVNYVLLLFFLQDKSKSV